MILDREEPGTTITSREMFSSRSANHGNGECILEFHARQGGYTEDVRIYEYPVRNSVRVLPE